MKVVGKRYRELSRLVSLIDEKHAIEGTLNEMIVLAEEEAIKSALIAFNSTYWRANLFPRLSIRKDQDPEMLAMIQKEVDEYTSKVTQLDETIMSELVPKDEDDKRPVVLEVRSGTGGDEASLFAGELFKMYEKFCHLKGWRWEQASIQRSEVLLG